LLAFSATIAGEAHAKDKSRCCGGKGDFWTAKGKVGFCCGGLFRSGAMTCSGDMELHSLTELREAWWRGKARLALGWNSICSLDNCFDN